MDTLASKEVVDHILEHHGVLGMKWGVRRASRSSGSSNSKVSQEISVKTGTSPRGHATISTHGGHKVPAHPDAIAAKKVEQQLKRSGHNSLSNEQMLKYANRRELENRVSRVAPPSDAQRVKRGLKKVIVFSRSPEAKTGVAVAKKSAKTKIGKRVIANIAKTAAVSAIRTAAVAAI